MLEKFEFYGAPDMDREVVEGLFGSKKTPLQQRLAKKKKKLHKVAVAQSASLKQKARKQLGIKPKPTVGQKLKAGMKMVFGKPQKVEGFWDDVFDQAMSEAEIPARVRQDLLSIQSPSKLSKLNRYAQGRVRVLQKHGLIQVGEGGTITLTKKGVAVLREDGHWSHADLRVIFEYAMPKSIGVGGSDKQPRAAAYRILAKSAERKQLDKISNNLISATKKKFPGARFDSNDAAEVMYAYMMGTPFKEELEAELVSLESTSSPFPEVRERRIQEVRAALQELSQD